MAAPAASPRHQEIFAGIDLLAATEGILTEPAGGTTVAVLEKLAATGRFAPDDTIVAIITGNGLKTLDDHPQKPWPAKVDCELDAMLAALGSEERRDADAERPRAAAPVSATAIARAAPGEPAGARIPSCTGSPLVR